MPACRAGPRPWPDAADPRNTHTHARGALQFSPPSAQSDLTTPSPDGVPTLTVLPERNRAKGVCVYPRSPLSPVFKTCGLREMFAESDKIVDVPLA